MTQALIGALRVNLGLDTAQFTTGIKKASAGLGGFKAKLPGLGQVLAVVTAGLGAVSAAFLKVAGDADRAKKAAQSLGLLTEEYTRLQLAADRSGVNNLNEGLRAFNMRIGDALNGARQAVDLFRGVGISLRDAEGNAKTARQLLGEVADVLQRMPDGVEKTRLAMAFFGEQGGSFVTMLNEGADGLKRFDDESDRLGRTLSTQAGAGFETFNDTLGRIGDTFGGLWRSISTALLPAFQALAGAFEQWLPTFRDWEPLIGALSFSFKVLAAVFLTAFNAARLVGEALQTLFLTVAKATSGDFSGALETIKGGFKDMGEVLAEQEGHIAALFEDVSESANRAADRVEAASRRITIAVRGNAGGGGVRVPILPQGEGGDAFSESARQAQRDIDRWNDEMRESERLVQGIGQTFASTVSGAIQAAITDTENLGRSLLNILGGLGGSLLNTGISALFSAGIGAAFASPAPVLPFPGFRTGGGFTVRGAGGPDSVPVGMMVSPNELVEVHRPGEGGGRAVTVNINGAAGNEEVRGLVAEGVAAGLRQYDRGLPGRIQEVRRRYE